MTEEWKALDENQKKVHIQASDREKARYEGEMRIFK